MEGMVDAGFWMLDARYVQLSNFVRHFVSPLAARDHPRSKTLDKVLDEVEQGPPLF
jgi:hypothetical protein